MLTRQRSSSESGSGPLTSSRSVSSLAHTPRIGSRNQVQPDGGMGPAFNFGDIPVFAPVNGGHRAARESTRAPGGADTEEDVTVNGGGAADAGAAPDAGPTGAAVTPRCEVASGPTYTPTGAIPPVIAGGRKTYPFTLAATFRNLSPAAILPSCCSVRQYIKWDQRYVDSKGGPPHSGFPSSHPVDTWIEDRDTRDKRYGHRSGPHADPVAGGGDEYTTRGVRDQAGGDTYNGRDAPSAPVSRTGRWQFRLDVIDTCNSNTVKASSSVITVNYG
jgi:hypothetical protein